MGVRTILSVPQARHALHLPRVCHTACRRGCSCANVQYVFQVLGFTSMIMIASDKTDWIIFMMPFPYHWQTVVPVVTGPATSKSTWSGKDPSVTA